nr:glycosyltransferase family 2 protein [Verrucomicrobiota bacterium]
MLPPFSVVIPAFNEAVRIGGTLRATLEYLQRESPASEVIVVNDGSTDATARIAREAFAHFERQPARLLEHFPNRGKGAAVREGLLAATQPIAIFFDADLSTPIEELPRIVDPIVNDDADVVFGSRALD